MSAAAIGIQKGRVRVRVSQQVWGWGCPGRSIATTEEGKGREGKYFTHGRARRFCVIIFLASRTGAPARA